MTEGLRKVKLYGELAREFGPVHRLAISSPAEAVRALCATIPGFEAWLIRSEERGVAYRVTNAGSPVREAEQLHHPTGDLGEVRIAPVLQGAKRAGLFQVFLGAVLIAASFFVPGMGIVLLGSTLGKMVFSVGVTMVLGGVVQMLSPQPKLQSVAERPENEPSYQFNGPVNTTSQGHPVPIGYGRLLVGSAVISAGISTSIGINMQVGG